MLTYTHKLVTGCGSDAKQGPHSVECLSLFWKEAGCYESGTSSPGSSPFQVLFWNSRTVADVKDDMKRYHNIASDGSEDYQRKCFGITCS